MDNRASVKNYTTTLLLAIFLGIIGAHRFYAGKVFTGLLFFVTLGFFGIGWVIDIITVAVGNFTDKTGRFIRPRAG
jgi:TM2 domain-containing membrane protein YozV